jgi:electron transfer flavoprotein alpha/beta subunit
VSSAGQHPLRIAVCIKQVPKAQELQVDPVTKTLKRVGVPSEINPPDQNALEVAFGLRERHGGEIFVVSMGPTSFDESLERAIAMGADRAYLVSDRNLGGSDTVPTALTLTRAIEKIGGVDLILCGEETTDASTGHVGPGIAGHMDLPQITYCSAVEVVDRKVRGTRMIEDGAEVWECAMPCLVTIDFGCNKPRRPTLTGKIRVKRGGVITHWSAADLGLEPQQIGLRGSPTIVAKVETVQLPARGGKIFQEEPTIAVSLLLEALRRDKAIR